MKGIEVIKMYFRIVECYDSYREFYVEIQAYGRPENESFKIYPKREEFEKFKEASEVSGTVKLNFEALV